MVAAFDDEACVDAAGREEEGEAHEGGKEASEQHLMVVSLMRGSN